MYSAMKNRELTLNDHWFTKNTSIYFYFENYNYTLKQMNQIHLFTVFPLSSLVVKVWNL